jgi:hypothetical protein
VSKKTIVSLFLLSCLATVGLFNTRAHAQALEYGCPALSPPPCGGANYGSSCAIGIEPGRCLSGGELPQQSDAICSCVLDKNVSPNIGADPAVSGTGLVALGLCLVGMALWAAYRRNDRSVK